MSIPSQSVKKLIFLLTTLLCVSTAVLYTLFSARKTNLAIHSLEPVPKPESLSAAPVVSPPDKPVAQLQDDVQGQSIPAGKPPAQLRNDGQGLSASPADKSAAQSQDQLQGQIQPRLVALILRPSDDVGKVEYSALGAADERRTATNLRCERVYFAANRGICLIREIHLVSADTVATLIDANFLPLFSVRTPGIPTRARISPDGRYAAFTVFVLGHSYADAQLSTATLLLDIAQGTTLANLEEFKVFQDGNVMQAVDFNYWGVTFQHDSNFFYATLRTGGVNYLVHGDIKARTVTVIHKGVECPSLSPDETRIAFKQMVSRANWRLTVLNLTTFESTPLAETRSVDDQAEWLDNDHVLYALPDPAPWMTIMVVPADGSGEPKVFAKGEASPAVVR